MFCLTLLNDERVASGSGDHLIIIYNKNNFQPDIIIKEHKNFVLSLYQLKNGFLASSSYDNTIKLFSIKENEYQIIQTLDLHKNAVFRIIELSNNSLVSCSDNSTIIFYIKEPLKYNQNYSFSASNSVVNIIQNKIK